MVRGGVTVWPTATRSQPAAVALSKLTDILRRNILQNEMIWKSEGREKTDCEVDLDYRGSGILPNREYLGMADDGYFSL